MICIKVKEFSLFDLNSARIYDGLKMYLVTSYKTDFFDLIKAKLEELCSEIKNLNVEEKKEKEEKQSEEEKKADNVEECKLSEKKKVDKARLFNQKPPTGLFGVPKHISQSSGGLFGNSQKAINSVSLFPQPQDYESSANIYDSGFADKNPQTKQISKILVPTAPK